jgi:exopolyphosphatase/guanosine-5'-triphosphate,3'-diphosphate pyrophosphatase
MTPTSLKAPRTIGFVDIGTNSVRLMVARVDPDHTWTTITLQKESVRLGEGEFGATSRLQPQAMARATLVCRTFVDMARAHGAQAVVAVATAATREAANQVAFLRMLRDEADLDVHVISGKEEARLVYLGMLTRVHLEDRHALVIDIGGGSTELALGDSSGARILDSVKLGAIRLTSEFPEAATVPLSSEVWRQMRRRVHSESACIQRALSGQRIDVVYGTSGTIRTLAALAARRATPQTASPETLRRQELRQVAKLLRSLDVESRRTLPGVNPERADIIVAGAAILDSLMEALGIAAICPLAECGVREGLVLDYLGRYSDAMAAYSPAVRERSVRQLARSAAVDEGHALHVADLAQGLFDSAAEAGLHPYGDAERELLRYAALMHDAGTFLSYSNHHAHSYYLIRNADLLGFDQREVATMAAIALFHRKSRPGPRHAAFLELDGATQDAVRTLSAYLRIAEYLDRGHCAAVVRATLRKGNGGDLILDVTPARDWHLERWRLEDRRAVVEDALGHGLIVRGAPVSTALKENVS